tara:strand:+ start:82 stop:279 length:198 start_codon:yes stop_codon:yes gene_type:complete
MKDNKDKIEFWLHENQKAALKKLSQDTGYTLSELMRRGAEYVIKELSPATQSYPENIENDIKPES